MSVERTDAERLAEATDVLRGHEVPIPVGAQARIGAALSARKSHRWIPRPLWIAAGATVAASLAWLLVSELKQTPRHLAPARPIVAAERDHAVPLRPSPGQTKLAPEQRIAVGQATLTAARPSVVRIADREGKTVTLQTGALDIVVAGSLTVRTPHVRLQSANGALHVAVRVAGTAISVSKGEVQVFSLDLMEKPSTLIAGQKTFVSLAPARAATVGVDEAQDKPREIKAARRTSTRSKPRPAVAKNVPIDDPGLEPSQPKALPQKPRQTSQPIETPRPAPPALPTPKPPAPSTKPPAPESAVIGLLRRADRLRRNGRFRQASGLYLEAANHRAGRAYVEEALLRRAILQAKRLGDRSGALQTLAAARRRLPATSALLPERIALTARILLDSRDADKAAKVLLSCAARSRALLQLRLETARLLWRSNPPPARALLAPLLDASAPQPLRRSALRLLQEKSKSPKKN